MKKIFGLIVLFVITNKSFAQDFRIKERFPLIDTCRHIQNDSSFINLLMHNLPDAKHKPILMLGESSHVVQEFSDVKCKIMPLLIDKKGYRAILFESGFAEMLVGYAMLLQKQDSYKIMQSIYPIFHTEAIIKLIDTLKKNSNKIYWCGFDIHPSSRIFTPFMDSLLHMNHVKSNFRIFDSTLVGMSLKRQTESNISLVKFKNLVNDTVVYNVEYRKLMNLVRKDNFTTGTLDSSIFKPLLAMALESRIELMKNLLTKTMREEVVDRDKKMNENVEWYMNFFKNNGIIIWAHNFHIAKKQNDNKFNKIMGEYIAKEYPDSSFALGLFYVNNTDLKNKRRYLTPLFTKLQSIPLEYSYLVSPCFDKTEENFDASFIIKHVHHSKYIK